MIILFRPFDLGKWFTIGFVSFLAMLAEGGASFNFPPYLTGGSSKPSYHSFPGFLHEMKLLPSSYLSSPWLIVYLVAGLFCVLAWVALTWVGSRGQFMILDNIVRNRGAIAIPWSQYARQGNVWFVLRLGLVFVSCLIASAVFLLMLAMNWNWIDAERIPRGSDIGILALSLVIGLTIFLCEAIVLFFIHAMVLPLYFKQTMTLGSAFASVANLISTRALAIFLYVLVNFLLVIAMGFVVLLLILLSCCCIVWFAFIPLAGSLLMSAAICQLILPVTLFSRCFQLDCLAQFGPQYDVWTVDIAPTPTAPFSPQPPLG